MPRLLEIVPASQRRLPDWLRKSLSPGTEATRTDTLIKDLGLHTICESGRCPNRNECYSQKTATFMLMGDICTRSCSFCSVSIGKPQVLDVDEPARVVKAVRELGLEHVVITSVNRDDLADEGATHFFSTVSSLRQSMPGLIVEILTPDFKRTQSQAVKTVMGAKPHIFNHNIETVPALYKKVRPQAVYEKSLSIFGEIRSHSKNVLTKSGLMLGLGETLEQVLQTMKDLKEAGCDMLTIGQYLQSSTMGMPVSRYPHPDEFALYKKEALAMGFAWVESAPFVRSSFHAKDSFEALKKSLKEKSLI